MTLIIVYPAIAVLSMFVLFVIILILKFGASWCKLRHTTFAEPQYWLEDEYEQKDSYA